MIVKIKPLSVNEAWQGRRFKTPKYKAYEKEVLLKLPKYKMPNGKLQLDITFGYSNKLNDVDNSAKPFLDILAKKYNFNDRDIYKLNLTKEIVNKGEEFIKYEFKEI